MLSGSAGVIQVALNVFEMTKDQDYLDLADMYSKHLAENVSILENGVAWKNKHTNSYLGGFLMERVVSLGAYGVRGL